MGDSESFGVFLKARRKEREITVLAMAEKLEFSPGTYCDIESNRLKPPSRETLDKILEILRLPDNDRERLFDLAGRARSAAPPDLPEYINKHEVVRVALRIAKEKASEDDWRRFIHDLEQKE